MHAQEAAERFTALIAFSCVTMLLSSGQHANASLMCYQGAVLPTMVLEGTECIHQ